MASDTYSATLGALLMATGNDNNSWGTNANSDVFQIFEDAIANWLSSAVTGGTLDLSGTPPPSGPSQARYSALVFTGTLTSNQVIKVPNLTKSWLVKNATSGAYTLTLQTPSGSASTAIPQNSTWQLVLCDGNNNIIVSPFNYGQIQMPDGSASAPAYSDINETNSGWYRHATQDWRLSINGADVLQVTGTGAASPSIINVLSPNSFEVNGNAVLANGQTFKVADGTVSAPGLEFNSENGTGLYRVSSGVAAFSLLGTLAWKVTANDFTWVGGTYAGTDLSPTSFSTSQNNYNPSNLATATCLRLNVTGVCSLTGLAGGAAGREITLENIGTATLQVPALSGSSSATNQFANTFNLAPGQSIGLRYDATASLWRPKNVATAYASCAIGAVSPDLKIVNDGTNPTTKLNITASEAVLVDASGNAIKFENVNLSVVTNAGSAGPGGFDTGSKSNSTPYFIWLVSDGVTLSAVFSLSSSLATVISNLQGTSGGVNYLYAKRVGWNQTDSSGNLYRVRQIGKRAQYVLTASTNTSSLPQIASGTTGTFDTASPTLSAVSVAGVVPSTAASISMIGNNDNNGAGILVAPNTAYGGTNKGPAGTSPNSFAIYLVNNASGNYVQCVSVMMLEGTTIGVAIGSGGGAFVSCLGWEDAV